MKKVIFIALALLVTVAMHAQTNSVPVNLPRAEAMYDFSGNGLKQAPIGEVNSTSGYEYDEEVGYYVNKTTTTITWQLSANATGNFTPQELYGQITHVKKGEEPDLGDANVAWVEDINGDGKADLSSFSAGIFVKTADGCERIDGLAVTNMDINRDGRMDYLILDRSRTLSNRSEARYGAIAYQLSDGSFQEQQMQVFTWDEFVEQMTDEERDQYQNPQNYSLGEVSRYTYTAGLGGASLARAPKRNAPEVKKAPGAGTLIGAPTKALDLNKDGLVDLIDEKNGIIYTNMDNGKWVWTTTNGAVVPADLNNDGVTDFVFPGAKLYTVIYDKTAKSFTPTILYQNATSDNIVYCYDFDKDGDIDILATFTAENNPTGYAYTCFFTNNGQGTFKKQAEQDYEDYALAFVGMQDLDGDGFYDLLAYTPKADRKYDLVWVKGKSGLKFNTTPQVLATDIITRETYWDNSKQPFSAYPVSAEDLNGDGKMEIWVSGTNYGSTELYSIENAAANLAPGAPAKPNLEYKDGLLTISWGNGSDDKTATGDLTYALRIGTTAGGNDILTAHAITDGTRRNFLDGNMGKEHTYTIDLTSYTPATIYVAVQTIDAQHAGSAWSEEANVVHDLVPVEFALDRTIININETAVLTFTALPEGYSHQWTIQDGSYVQSTESASKLILSFTSGGTKTITHTVTTPNGGTKTASATIFVMPAGIGEKVELTDEQMLTCFFPMADYTYDERMDGVLPTNRSSGTYYSFTVQRGKENGLFSNAPGLWNTNILTEGMYVNEGSFIWYDWNKDGNVDLLFYEKYGNRYNYAYLPHEEDGYTLSSRVDDEDLATFFAEKNQDYPEFNYLLTDIDNNGYLDSVAFVLNPLAGTDSYGSDLYGLYAWYKEGENVIAEGFLVPAAGNAGSIVTECYLTPEEHCLVVNYAREFNGLYPIITQADTRPAAPTNVRATMTDDGLLITWDAAVDDHTPAASMRYNLSVKQQGADTYLVSPQNGGNEDAMYIPGYDYIEGTSYLIPTSELGTGRCDIQLQALDLQNKLSVFSETVTATVMRNPIEVQSFGCANDYITVSYRGEESTGTPVWNFDGGVATGSGFGPYEVYWENGGEKTISLTLDGQTYTATITIDNPGELEVAIPDVLYEETPATASVPYGVDYQWLASVNGGDIHPVDEYGIILNLDEHNNPYSSTIVSYDTRLTVNGLNVTAHYVANRTEKTLVGEDVILYLRVTNANGCETYFSSLVTVMAATAIPTLTLVTTDANGHNVIAWTNADAFATVNIYKEGEVLNEYELIGSETASVGSFTDTHSDASQKAERYRITGVLANGNESPASGVHKTVHLAINRGIEEGTFNLIWNEYAGADVVSYNILRGATPTSLEKIATVASSNVSYTDRAPVDEKPYYVLEYVLSSASAAPSHNTNRAPKANVAGRSNVVDRRNAGLGIENIATPADKARKVMMDGTLYIATPDGKIYNATGVQVK